MTVAGRAAQTPPSGPVAPRIAAGAHDFVQFACAQCHGVNGRGGISISGLAPGAAVAFLPLFAIEEWRDRRTATESFVEISGRWRGRPRWYEQSRTKRLA